MLKQFVINLLQMIKSFWSNLCFSVCETLVYEKVEKFSSRDVIKFLALSLCVDQRFVQTEGNNIELQLPQYLMDMSKSFPAACTYFVANI